MVSVDAQLAPLTRSLPFAVPQRQSSRLKNIGIVFLQSVGLSSNILGFFIELIDLTVVRIGANDETRSVGALDQSLRSALRRLDHFPALVIFLDFQNQVLLELVVDLKPARLVIFLRGCLTFF